MLKPGRGKGIPNRGRGGARYRGGEDGTSGKRKQQPQVYYDTIWIIVLFTNCQYLNASLPLL